jgi:hypothetical protein
MQQPCILAFLLHSLRSSFNFSLQPAALSSNGLFVWPPPFASYIPFLADSSSSPLFVFHSSRALGRVLDQLGRMLRSLNPLCITITSRIRVAPLHHSATRWPLSIPPISSSRVPFSCFVKTRVSLALCSLGSEPSLSQFIAHELHHFHSFANTQLAHAKPAAGPSSLTFGGP